MDVNPLLANIGFSAVAGAIEGAISGEGIFEHMFDMYADNALAFLGGGTSSDPWMQAAYIAQIQDFTEIAREKGLINALNTYATGFFNSTAVNSIVRTGLTIGEYFQTKWDAGQTEQVDLKNGETTKGVRVEDTESILLFDDEGNVIGLKEGKSLNFGEIGVDGEGKMGLIEGDMHYWYDEKEIEQRIEKDQNGSIFIKKIVVYDPFTGKKTTMNPLMDDIDLGLGTSANSWTDWYIDVENTTLDSYLSEEYQDNRSEMTYIISNGKVTNSKEVTQFVFYDKNKIPVVIKRGVEIYRTFNDNGDMIDHRLAFKQSPGNIGKIITVDDSGNYVAMDVGNEEGLVAFYNGKKIYVGSSEDMLMFNAEQPKWMILPEQKPLYGDMDWYSEERRLQGNSDASSYMLNIISVEQDIMDAGNSMETTSREFESFHSKQSPLDGTFNGVSSGYFETISGIRADAMKDSTNILIDDPFYNSPWNRVIALNEIKNETSSSVTRRYKYEDYNKEISTDMHQTVQGKEITKMVYVGDELVPFEMSFSIDRVTSGAGGDQSVVFSSSYCNKANGEYVTNVSTLNLSGDNPNELEPVIEYVANTSWWEENYPSYTGSTSPEVPILNLFNVFDYSGPMEMAADFYETARDAIKIFFQGG